jgi:hypothetical protein
MAHLHLWHHRIVFKQDVCALLELELSWGTNVMLMAFPESAGNTLYSSLQQNTELIVLAGQIRVHYVTHILHQPSKSILLFLTTLRHISSLRMEYIRWHISCLRV